MLKVRGYASVFGVLDADDEIVDVGACSQWLAENPETVLFFMWSHAELHDPLAMPVGHTYALRQDSYGLYYEGVIVDTPAGLALQALLNSCKRVPASIFFRIIGAYEQDEIWHFDNIEPMEITATIWGVNPKAYMEVIPENTEPEENDL